MVWDEDLGMREEKKKSGFGIMAINVTLKFLFLLLSTAGSSHVFFLIFCVLARFATHTSDQTSVVNHNLKRRWQCKKSENYRHHKPTEFFFTLLSVRCIFSVLAPADIYACFQNDLLWKQIFSLYKV